VLIVVNIFVLDWYLKKKDLAFFVTATPPSDIIDKAYAYNSGFILHY